MGTEFLDTVDATLAHIALPTQVCSCLACPPSCVCGAHVKRFPYHIVYINLETETTIRVLAVAHDRRKPGYWKSRL